MQRGNDPGDETNYDDSPLSRESGSSVVDSTTILNNPEDGLDVNDPVWRSLTASHFGPDRSHLEIHAAPVTRSALAMPKGLETHKVANRMADLDVGMDDAPPGFMSNPTYSFHQKKSFQTPTFKTTQQPLQPLASVNAMELEQDSFNKDAEVPILPPCYSYNTSVVSKSDRDIILQGLSDSLNKFSDIQFKVNRNYKIRGTIFIEERMVTFMIHMFQTVSTHPHPDCILLEFQRRDGDSIVFQRFFRSVVEDMSKKSLVDYSGHPHATALPSTLPLLMNEEYGQLDFSRDPGLPGNLVKMCNSVYLEPRREATGVLAKGSRRKENVAIIAALGLTFLNALCNLLKNCHDLQTIRNSAVVLNNMFTHDANFRVGAGKNILKDLCSAFLKWSGAEELHQVASSVLVCRELSEALEKLMATGDFAKSVQNNSPEVQCLQKIATKSPHRELNDRAKKLVRLITA